MAGALGAGPFSWADVRFRGTDSQYVAMTTNTITTRCTSRDMICLLRLDELKPSPPEAIDAWASLEVPAVHVRGTRLMRVPMPIAAICVDDSGKEAHFQVLTSAMEEKDHRKACTSCLERKCLADTSRMSASASPGSPCRSNNVSRLSSNRRVRMRALAPGTDKSFQERDAAGLAARVAAVVGHGAVQSAAHKLSAEPD